MYLRFVLFVCGWVATIGTCLGQLPGYVHYDINNGLAGSTVYNIIQDKDGFLWMATNAGLCRYDGTRFVNYTLADGLSETEIIQVYADTKGRVWFAPFKNSIGYYYQGKIHTSENDSLLRNIHFKNVVLDISEDAHGNISLDGSTPLDDHVQITPQGKIQYGYRAVKPFCLPVFRHYHPTSNSNYQSHSTYYALYGIYVDQTSHIDSLYLFSCHTQKQYTLPKKYLPVTLYVVNDTILYINSTNGVYEYNLSSGKLQGEYLKGLTVTCTFQDDEKNIWFGTLENGLYKKINPQIHTFSFHTNTGYDKGIYCFQQLGGEVYAANETIWQVKKQGRSTSLWVTPWSTTQQSNFSQAKLIYFVPKTNGHVLCVGSTYIADIDRKTHQVCRSLSVAPKNVWEYNKDCWLIAGSGDVSVFNHTTWKTERIVWKKRATAVAARNDTIWVGTLRGLYMVCPSDTVYLGGLHKVLDKRIARICPAADGSVWVATYGYGLVQWKNGAVLYHFTQANGLSGNICTSLVLQKDTVWVGTDHGVSRLTYQGSHYQIDVLNTHFGLGSDYIHAVFIHQGTSYIGTSVGMTVFPCQIAVPAYKPRLVFMGVFSDNTPLTKQAQYVFTYPKIRNIRFEFSGISYSQAGAMQYAYKLDGLDSQWHTTRQPFVEYASLPGGKYVLHVVAYSGFDKASNRLKIPFQVLPPLWERGWFQLLLGLLGVGMCSGVIYLWFQYLRKKNLTESQIASQLVELKHRALKAQMNPHFVFNSLNAIQQFIFSQDKERTNRYLSTLSRVIRQTLELTSRNSSTVQEEMNYLTNYLILEQMRFDGEFTYQIDFDQNSPCSQWHIPSMIIQPYVENSIRHGIRYKREAGGWVCVRVDGTDTDLCITVTDNGVGRQRAESYKSNQPIEYQSRGTSLTQERMEILNQKYAPQHKARIEIQDLYAHTETCVGTQVTITLPLEIIHHLTHD